MFGRMQTVGMFRGVRLVHPRCQTHIHTRAIHVVSTLRFRPAPSILGSCQKSRNLWGWSSKPATEAVVEEIPVPVEPAAEQEAVATATVAPDVSADTALSTDSLASIPAEQEAIATATAAPDVSADTALPMDSLASIPAEVPVPVDIPPLQYGDLAALGFAHWTPAGISQWVLELTHVATGMPWFWTIIVITIASRAILLPSTLLSLRTTARLAPFQPKLMGLRDKLSTMAISKDPMGVQRLRIEQKKVYDEAGVSMLSTLVAPVVQLPVSLGMFFGIKKLCDAHLPQLTQSGISFLPDLTIGDPTYTLPLITALLINAQINVTSKDATMGGPEGSLHLFNFFKFVTFLSIPVLAHFSSGILVYLTTSSLIMLTQSWLLRMPAVRRALNIPIIPKKFRATPPTARDTLKYVASLFRNKSTVSPVQPNNKRKL